MNTRRLNKYITLSVEMEDGHKMPVAHFGIHAQSDKDVTDKVKEAVQILNLFGKHLLVDVEDV